MQFYSLVRFSFGFAAQSSYDSEDSEESISCAKVDEQGERELQVSNDSLEANFGPILFIARH